MIQINFNKLPIYILTGSCKQILLERGNQAGLYYAVSTSCDLVDIKERIIEVLDKSINDEQLAPAGLKRGIIGKSINQNIIGWTQAERDDLYVYGINPIHTIYIQYYSNFVIWGTKFINLDGDTDRIFGFYDNQGTWINFEINPKFIDFVHHYNAVEDIMEPILPIPTTPIDPSWPLQYGLSITTPSTTNIKLT